MKTRDKVNLLQLCKKIADISTVSVVDTIAVIESMIKLIPEMVVDGDIVKLGDFGIFSVNIESDGVEKEKDFTREHIEGLKLNFRSGKLIKKALEDVTFVKE